MQIFDEHALDAQDVADLLHVSRNTVYNLVKEGLLSSYMVGRKMRFTLSDVDDYIARERVDASKDKTAQSVAHKKTNQLVSEGTLARNRDDFTLAGNDMLADVLANILGQNQMPISRAYVNSYHALEGMYRGQYGAAVIHLFDRASQKHNLPFVQSLVPGKSLVVFHLASRQVGLIVPKRNQKKILKMRDLTREDVFPALRELGASERIMFDEYLVQTGAPASAFGRGIEARSSLSAAEFVAAGYADVTLGNEQTAGLVKGLGFIPLQKEELVLVLVKETEYEQIVYKMRDLLVGDVFKAEVSRVGSYDLSRCGNILYEV